MKIAALLALGLVACGGAVSSPDGDQGDAAAPLEPARTELGARASDASATDASVGSCVVGGDAFACGSVPWSWAPDGGAWIDCISEACPSGATCEVGGAPGVCL